MRTAFLLLLGLAVTAHADILIYSGSSTGKVTGLGYSYTMVTYSKVVVDAENGYRAGVGWFTLNGQKYFNIDETQVFRPTIIGPGGKRMTVAAFGHMGQTVNGYFYVRQGFGKGNNTTLFIRPTRPVDFPATFQITDKVVQDGANGSISIEATGSNTFLQAATQSANSKGETLEQAIARFAAQKIAQGYTQIGAPQ